MLHVSPESHGILTVRQKVAAAPMSYSIERRDPCCSDSQKQIPFSREGDLLRYRQTICSFEFQVRDKVRCLQHCPGAEFVGMHTALTCLRGKDISATRCRTLFFSTQDTADSWGARPLCGSRHIVEWTHSSLRNS